jgi:hypothetical protein
VVKAEAEHPQHVDDGGVRRNFEACDPEAYHRRDDDPDYFRIQNDWGRLPEAMATSARTRPNKRRLLVESAKQDYRR